MTDKLLLTNPKIGTEPPVTTAGRTAEPNPYEPAVKALVDAHKQGKVLVNHYPPVPYKTDEDKAAVKSAKATLQRAGRKFGVSVRVNVDADDKTKTARVSVWVVDKITRDRKTEVTEPEGKGEVKPPEQVVTPAK